MQSTLQEKSGPTVTERLILSTPGRPECSSLVIEDLMAEVDMSEEEATQDRNIRGSI
jgi:hypothetical protein